MFLDHANGYLLSFMRMPCRGHSTTLSQSDSTFRRDASFTAFCAPS